MVSLPSHVGAPRDSGSRPWPIVGREAELDALEQAARSGGALVTGPIASGLTTLLTQLSDRLPATRYHVSLAYASRRTAGADLAALAHLAEPPPAHRTSTDQVGDRIVALLGRLEREAEGRHIVVVVDDAEWLDPASLTLLERLVAGGAGTLIAAYHRITPASIGLEAMWRSGSLDLVETSSFGVPQLQQLFDSRHGGTLAEPTASYLIDAVAGRPGWLRPLLDDAEAAGVLVEKERCWVFARREFPMPRLGRAVRAALGEERPEVGEVVRHVALVDGLPLPVLDAIVGRKAVLEAEENGWVRVGSEVGDVQRPRVWVAVDAVARGQLELIAPAAARTIRSTIVGHWGRDESMTPQDELRLVIASRDSDVIPTPAELGRAAATAARDMRPHLAGQLAGEAIVAKPRFHDLAIAANMSALRNRGPRDSAIFAALAEQATSDHELAAVAYQKGLAEYWTTGQSATAARDLEQLESMLSDPSARAGLKATRGAYAADAWQFDKARALVAEAMAGPHGDLAIIGAGYANAVVHFVTGMPIEQAPSPALVDAAFSRQPEFITGLAPWLGLLGRLPFLMGPDAEIEEILARRSASALTSQDEYGAALGTTLKGQMALRRGEVQVASHYFAEANVLLDQEGARIWIERTGARLALAYALMGDPARASAALAVARERQSDPGRVVGMLDDVASIWIEADTGAISSAVALARRSAEAAREQGAYGHELTLLVTALGLGDGDTATRLQELYELRPTLRSRVIAGYARAFVARDAAALDRAADDLYETHYQVLSLTARSQATALHLKQRNLAAYWNGLRQARVTQQETGALPPAWLAIKRPLPLTAREEEVARLASGGLSSQQIAEHLTISVRTAEGHLQRAYSKLGVHGRLALAAALGVASSDT